MNQRIYVSENETNVFFLVLVNLDKVAVLPVSPPYTLVYVSWDILKYHSSMQQNVNYDIFQLRQSGLLLKGESKPCLFDTLG